MAAEPSNPDDLSAVARAKESCDQLRVELAKVIVGHQSVIEQVLVAVFSRGHALLEGVPGLAKTLLIRSLAEAMRLAFARIQFTPDLLPSDLTGDEVVQEDLQTGGRTDLKSVPQRAYQFRPGSVFANLILADEINHAPRKTQAAMLDAMQERQISVGGKVHRLPEPLFVLATQNPLEQEAAAPLDAAQLDRFLLYIKVGYPAAAEEREIARRATATQFGRVTPLLSADEILEIQRLVTRLPVSDQVLEYACALVRSTRPGSAEALDFIDRWAAWGAGPRGVLALVTCAKARAVLHGRCHATPADVQAMVRPALRHRIAANDVAQANNLTSDGLIDMLMEALPAGERMTG